MVGRTGICFLFSRLCGRGARRLDALSRQKIPNDGIWNFMIRKKCRFAADEKQRRNSRQCQLATVAMPVTKHSAAARSKEDRGGASERKSSQPNYPHPAPTEDQTRPRNDNQRIHFYILSTSEAKPSRPAVVKAKARSNNNKRR